VAIGNGVTARGAEAFESCSNLAAVTVGNGVTNVGLEVFTGCGKLGGEYIFRGTLLRSARRG
jgi:hypothetical protein